MTQKDFWRKSTVAVIGGGSWGTCLAHLASLNCTEVRMWIRNEERARVMNATRVNPDYVSGLQLGSNVRILSSLERVFEARVHAVIWALPSAATRPMAKEMARYLHGDEVLFHATKGVEEGSLKRVSEILREEFPVPRIGVISGPNLAGEIARGEPAATVVASEFHEVVGAGFELLSSEKFRVYGASDVVGVEWAGTLKNTLAIASGALAALGLGWNARSMLITRGLAEMVRFGVALGAQHSTFLGLAGIGDLLATCSSPLSRNYRVGAALAKGQKLDEILTGLGGTAEGVRTTRSVHEFARARGISMPITGGVYMLVGQEAPIHEIIRALMLRPPVHEENWK